MEVQFGKAVYSLYTLKKAAYRFSDKVAFDFVDNGDFFLCKIQAKHQSSEDLEAIAFAFKNEVLDQDLREKIAQETEGVRNLILAHTFSNTGLG